MRRSTCDLTSDYLVVPTPKGETGSGGFWAVLFCSQVPEIFGALFKPLGKCLLVRKGEARLDPVPVEGQLKRGKGPRIRNSLGPCFSWPETSRL